MLKLFIEIYYDMIISTLRHQTYFKITFGCEASLEKRRLALEKEFKKKS